MDRQYNKVIIIGGGTMGRGITQVFLQSSFPVTLVDVKEEVLQSAEKEIEKRLQRMEEKGRLGEQKAAELYSALTCSNQMEGHQGELIIEAIVENIDIKKKVFQQLDQAYPPSTVIASNTSSLSISEMASVVSHPDRVIGMHFFNPAPLMPLVEVIEGMETDPQLVEQMLQLLEQVGKSPVQVKDTPGFIVNRVARPFYNEALKMVGDNVADIEQIDKLLKDAGFRMGPFELQDLIGIDINFATTCSLYESYFHDPRFRPSPLQEIMVKSNRLGRKTGKGFYTYETR